MNRKNYMKQSTLMTLILAGLMAMFTVSCSSSDATIIDDGGLKPTDGNNLVVYIGTTSSTYNGRAVALTDPGTAVENKINTTTLLIFGANGVAKTIQEVEPKDQLINTRVPNLSAGDKVYLAVNVPASVFSTVTRVADFEETKIDIDRAILGDATDKTIANPGDAPMFGKGSLEAVPNETDVYRATVPVNHMLAKVTLNTITASLEGDAEFTPTEVYLKNVPPYLYLETAESAAKQDYRFFNNEGGTFYQGEPANAEFFKPYLGSGVNLGGFQPTNPTLTRTASSWHENAPAMVFYTMPNNPATPTMLVIKGNYKPANTTESKTVKYSIYLNHNTNSNIVPNGGPYIKQLYPNYNYSVDLFIKNASVENIDPTPGVDYQYYIKVTEDYTFGVLQSINAQFQQNDRLNQEETSGTQQVAGNTTINGPEIANSYENYDFLNDLSVGNFLFSDGSYGSIPNNPGKTPIAIIFSTNTTSYDKSQAYIHGYAMALKDMTSTYTWGSQLDNSSLTNYNGTTSYLDRMDMEGFMNRSYESAASYAASYAAKNSYGVAAPTGTSGWFLPSSGQWFEIISNLGSLATTGISFDGWHGTTENMISARVANSINNRMSALPSSSYDPFEVVTPTGESIFYWSSTEHSTNDALAACFANDGSMLFATNKSKTATCRVRPIIAF
ncbi:MAG: hypothetical protein E7104_07180 [Prevotella sp.]|nr:hypothetical protein [Prevotella sp.]